MSDSASGTIGKETGTLGGDRSISVGRDALGNVFVTGEGNTVTVTLVVADQRLLERLETARATPRTENPYRGLDAFYESNAQWFFGRTKLSHRAWTLFQKMQRTSTPRILAIVGPSGSGKSSLVRAGFLPELIRNPMEGLEGPKVLVLRPGPLPLERLAEVVRRLPDQGDCSDVEFSDDITYHSLHRRLSACVSASRQRLIVVVDQFEELYTECVDADVRSKFLEILAFAASQRDGLVSVIITLRNDFTGAVKSPTAFLSAVRETPLRVQVMDRDELREAIARPARELGSPWPQPLVESLIAQTEGRAGALPLLQFALKRLWAEHIKGQLRDTSWQSTLVEDFLVQAADALFDTAGALGEDRATHQRILRSAFIAMVQLGEGTADTRRVAHLGEIVSSDDDPEHVRNVLAPFTAPEARLVTASEEAGEPTYELTHEALISSWDRLQAWLGNVPDKSEGQNIRADLRLRRRLLTAATEWKLGKAGLWRPPELDLLLAYLERTNDCLTAAERAFAEMSRSDWNEQQARAERTKRRLRLFSQVAFALAGFLALATAASLYFWRGATHEADSVRHELGRQYVQRGWSEQSAPGVLFFVHALRVDGDNSARADIHRRRININLQMAPVLERAVSYEQHITNDATGNSILDGLRIPGYLDFGGGYVRAAYFLPKIQGLLVLTNKKVLLQQGSDVKVIAEYDRTSTVKLSDDRSRFVVFGARSATKVFKIPANDEATLEISLPVGLEDATLNADGSLLAGVSDSNRQLVIWDVGKNRQIPVPSSVVGTDDIRSFAFHPDSKRLTQVGSGEDPRNPNKSSVSTAVFAETWEIGTEAVRRINLFDNGIEVVKIIPERDEVAYMNSKGDLEVVSLKSGSKGDCLGSKAAAKVTLIGATPEQPEIFVAREDGSIKFWFVSEGLPMGCSTGSSFAHPGQVRLVSFDKTGAWVITADGDSFAIPGNFGDNLRLTGHSPIKLWHYGRALRASTVWTNRSANYAELDKSGQHMVVASSDQTVRIWNVANIVAPPRIQVGAPVSDIRAVAGTTQFTLVGPWPPLKIEVSATSAAKSPFYRREDDGARLSLLTREGRRIIKIYDDHLSILDAETGLPTSNNCNATANAFLTVDRHGEVFVSIVKDGETDFVFCDIRPNSNVDWLRSEFRRGSPRSSSPSFGSGAFAPDRSIFAAMRADGAIKLCDLEQRRCQEKAGASTADTHADSKIKFSDDGKLLIAFRGEKLRIFRVDGFTEITPEALTPAGEIHDVATIADPDRVITLTQKASMPSEVRLWNMRTGLPVSAPMTLERDDEVTGAKKLVVSPNAKMLATVSEDGVVLWDIASGDRISPNILPPPIMGYAPLVAFSGDSNRLVIVTHSIDPSSKKRSASLYSWDIGPVIGSIESLERRALLIGGWSLDQTGTLTEEPIASLLRTLALTETEKR